MTLTEREAARPAQADLFPQMRAALARWVDLPDPQWARLAGLFRPRAVAQHEYVVLPGSPDHELMFVCSGLLRFFYVREDGGEYNKAFVAENHLSGALAAFELAQPIPYGVQALEPATLLVAPYAAFAALFDEHPLFERLGRKFAEWLLIRKELRTWSLQQQRAAERYRDFLDQHPDLAQRVPQYHIASYLGITEVSLSRLKRSLAEAA